MSSKPTTIRVFTKRFRTKKQQQLLVLLNDKSVKVQANTIIKDTINQFVPMKTGTLRESADVTPESISWGKGLKYAGYQYRGEVYGPNYPRTKNGAIVGWYSKRGMQKYPTGRELGVPGEWMGWRFGYTTANTQHHWDRQFVGPTKLKASIEITRLLKRECKRRGLRA